MPEADREPCPACAEPISSAAKLCPHCHSSVLFELVLSEPIRDGRVRYQAARALAARTGRPFLELQQALASARPRPVRDVPRSVAREAGAALEAFAIAWSVEPGRTAPTPAARGGSRPAWLAPAGGAAALVVLALFAARLMRSDPGPEAAALAAQGATAEAPAAVPPSASAAAASDELSPADLAERALASTVALRCPNAIGAGFFVTPDLVLTNAHVAVCDADMKVVLADGRSAAGVVQRRDQRLDLALVRTIGLQQPALPLGDAGELRVGDRVTLIGSPVGMEFSVHEGSVSNLTRMVFGVAYIQLDAKINPGNSGGPLLDRRGHAVGVVSLKRLDAEGIGLALPINYAHDGAGAMIEPPPAGRARSEGFARMLAKASAEEQQLVTELATAPQLPMLVKGGWDRYQRLVVVIARVSGYPLPAQDIKVRVLRGEQQVCEMSGGVREWTRVERDAAAAATEGMEARVQEWLRSTGLGGDIYVGQVPLRFDLCRLPGRSGYTLELVGAEPKASRLSF